MKTNDRLILECKAWSKEKLLADKNFFHKLSGMGNPGILWVGSSDSLFSVREITNTEPGEILLYQNIANQTRKDDLSFMALLEDALETEKIDLIIVCGYGRCNGIRSVIDGIDGKQPTVKNWLSGLIATYEEHRDELDRLPLEQKEDRLSELNIQQQITNLSEMDIIRRSWEARSAPLLLGWYFDLPSGDIKELFRMEPQSQPAEVSAITG